MTAARMFAFLGREVRGVHEAAYVLAFFTLGSQLVGLLRDRIFAHSFGIGETLDIFYAAFRVPDTLYALLASLISLFVLIPFFERAEHEGTHAIHTLLSELFTFFSAALCIAASVAWVFAPQLVALLYGGMYTHADQLVTLVRILLLQPLLLGVSNLFSAYVQTRGRFVLYAVAPILYNVGIILGAVFLYPLVGLEGLAWGVVIGALLHVGVQTPFVVQEGVFPRIKRPSWRRVREVIAISIPRTLALSTQQLVLVVLVGILATVGAGAISTFTFAWNLAAVPLALIGSSYSVAAFPTLVRLFRENDTAAFATLVRTAVRQVLFWAMPITALILVLREEIVYTLLGSGAFDETAVRTTAAVLVLLAVSLVAQAMNVLLIRVAYAAGRTFVPLVVSITGACVTVVLALVAVFAEQVSSVFTRLLIDPLQLQNPVSTAILAVPCAVTVGAFAQTVLLVFFVRRVVRVPFGPTGKALLHIGTASLCAALCAYGGLAALALLFPALVGTSPLMRGAVAGTLGVVMWVGVLTLYKDEDIVRIVQILRNHRRQDGADTSLT